MELFYTYFSVEVCPKYDPCLSYLEIDADYALEFDYKLNYNLEDSIDENS